MVLFESVFCGFWALNFVLICCETGQRFSDAFNKVSIDLVELNWYLLPMEIQRIFPPVIQLAQQPVAVCFFGNMSCSRKQFKKVSIWKKQTDTNIILNQQQTQGAFFEIISFQVMNTGYKYFMVLRKFYK